MQRVHKSIHTKSRRFCSVPQCASYCTKETSLHSFPGNKKLYAEWQHTLKIGKPISKYMLACSKHFLDSDFMPVTPLTKIKRLKKGVVPSQNLPLRKSKASPLKINRGGRKWLKEDFNPGLSLEETVHAEAEDGNVIIENDVVAEERHLDPVNETSSSRSKDQGIQTNSCSFPFKLPQLLTSDEKLRCFTGVDYKLLNIYKSCAENTSLANLFVEFTKNLEAFDTICGVPYTALPIATAVSIKTGIPMLMRRKEAKAYGTKKLIEGVYKEGNSCVIIEDVVTSGSSVLETVADLRNAGIKCSHAIVLLNREQGGANILESHGIKMHALFTLTQLLKYLKEEQCIGDDIVKNVNNYLQETQISTLKNDVENVIMGTQLNRLKLSYLERIPFCKNPVAQRLFQIMNDKQTNLCLSADVTKTTDLFELIEETGSEICMLKTHIDILEDFSPSTATTLQMLSLKYNFVLLEDRKFGDIGQIVHLQYTGGLYKISSWADSVTAHSITGKGLLEGIANTANLEDKAVFLLAETSAAGNLIDERYTKETVKFAEEYSKLICGFVCQTPLFLDNPGIIHLIPGVQLENKCDGLGQQYNTPECAILECGGDIAVVGRGITKASNKKEAATRYKRLLFDSYKKRLL